MDQPRPAGQRDVTQGLLAQLWPEDAPGARCIVSMRAGGIRHHWLETTQAAADLVADLERLACDIYFAPFLFPPDSRRTADAAQAARALWLDIDCGEDKEYPDRGAAAQALLAWCDRSGVPYPTVVVSSGYGLHVYWVLDRPYPRMEWLPVAQHLKQAAALHQLRCDPVRTADPASILRVPGTTNHKRGEAAPVRTLGDTGKTYSLAEFRAALPAVGPVAVVAPSTRQRTEWDIPADFPPTDANKINARCGQLGHVMLTQGAVGEPLWRAALSVWWRCTDGRSLIHTWSQGDSRYKPAETARKAEGTAGPATCDHFASVNPLGCEGCPFAGKISSPISLGVADAPVVAPGDDSEGEQGSQMFGAVRAQGYIINEQGVWTEAVSSETGPKQISEVPVWIEEVRVMARRTDERGHTSLQLAWLDVRGQPRHALLDAAELTDQRLFLRWLADHHLASFIMNPLAMTRYISKLDAATLRQRHARVVYGRLGWHDGGRLFVLGDKAVGPKGVTDTVVESSNTIAQLSPRGSAAAWRQATTPLGRPEYATHAFVVLAGLGAPLLHLRNWHGAVVALTGSSGFGKTLAASFALSAFVDPDLVLETGGSTLNGIEGRLVAHQHVPVLVDEVTGLSPEVLGKLIYMAANGRSRGAKTRTGKDRPTHTWATTTFLTSNHSILDRAHSQIEEAHRRRLIELPVTQCIDRATALGLVAAIRDHAGAAAAPYLQLLIRHRAQLPKVLDTVERYVSALLEASSVDRFAVWALTSALVGGLLGRMAGIIDFDPVAVVKQIIGTAKQEVQALPTDEERAFTALSEFLVTYSRNVCSWPATGIGTPTDNPVARVTDGRLFVRATAINTYWADEHINRASIKEWLAQVTINRQKARLAPGTVPVDCYVFDMAKLGITEADIRELEK